MALSFNARKDSFLRISLFPVAVQTISAVPITLDNFFTSKPSIAACKAQIGSTSVTLTRAPAPRRDAADPLPTSPYPHTTAVLPAIIVSVARRIPSTRDSLQPYLLSNFDLVTESLTLIAGTKRELSFSILFKAFIPVVVSSETPFISSIKSLYSLCIIAVKSPPSSKSIFGFQSGFPTIVCFMHQRYSSSVSPFHAKTGIPAFAIAAAA